MVNSIVSMCICALDTNMKTFLKIEAKKTKAKNGSYECYFW